MKEINDFLSLLTNQDDEVLTGTYYPKLLNTPAEGGVKFAYDIIDESDRSYATLIDTVQTDRAVQTIKTNDPCGFEIKSHIVTQDGNFWQITGMLKKLKPDKGRHILRYFKQAPETVYILRLIEVDNPWELE